MSPTRALLFFPLRPGDASRSLARGPWGLAMPLLPSIALALWLILRGCPATDAWIVALGLLVLQLGLGLGGALGCLPAALITDADPSVPRKLSPCFAFAGWSALIFAALLVALVLVGAGGKSVLFAGFAVLGWGVAAGTAVTTPEEGTEGGRALVASCLGLTGSVGGLWCALLVVTTHIAMLLPAPVDHSPITAGDMLVVRTAAVAAEPGELVFLRNRESASVVLAKLDSGGDWVFIGLDNATPLLSTNWDTLGRVCFAFGSSSGGYGVFPQRASD